MSNNIRIQRVLTMLLLSIVTTAPCLFAEAFRGEVTSVDSAKGNVNVRYRNQDGQVVAERTFHTAAGTGQTSTGMQSLNDLEVGDNVSINAFNRNGSWEIQSFDTAAQGNPSAVFAGGASGDSAAVFAARPNTSVTSPLFPTATATTTAGGTPLNTSTQTSIAAGSRTNSVGSSSNFGPSGTMSTNNSFSSGNPGGNAAATANSGISTSTAGGQSSGTTGAGAPGAGGAA